MVNIIIERKLQVNRWLIKARWLYGLGVFIIGALTKIISDSNVSFSYFSMALLLVIFSGLNVVMFFIYRLVERKKTLFSVQLLSCAQMFVELFILGVIMHDAGGIESISTVFFFMPIVSAAFLFGTLGSITTALLSAIVINSIVLAEYYNIIPHIYRYGVPTLEYGDLAITLTKTIATSVFYLIVSIYSSFGAELLISREKSLQEKTLLLNQKTNLLTKREKKLYLTNALLLEEKNKISSIISNFTDPIIFIDFKGSLSLFNEAARKILGFDDRDIGTKISEKDDYSLNNFKILAKNNYEIIKTFDEDGNKAEEEVEIDYLNQKRIYKVKSAIISDKSKAIYGYLKIFYDLTREKAIDKMKSEFISIAAHQLRTPLSAIKWVIKMILDGDAGQLNEEQTELLSKGYSSNERIIGLVNDLLNVSRIEEGRFGYNFKKEDFEEIIKIVLENIENIVKLNNLKLTINKPEKFPKINMDKERVGIVLQNLVDNAIKYTPAFGKIEINFFLEKRFLKVSVKDNGVGIPEQEKAKLFTKFFRASNVMRMQTEGSGLGLFIVKNIVEKHGGQVEVSSQEGKGTEISFTLPLEK